jgi:hypothetical protein
LFVEQRIEQLPVMVAHRLRVEALVLEEDPAPCRLYERQDGVDIVVRRQDGLYVDLAFLGKGREIADFCTASCASPAKSAGTRTSGSAPISASGVALASLRSRRICTS